MLRENLQHTPNTEKETPQGIWNMKLSQWESRCVCLEIMIQKTIFYWHIYIFEMLRENLQHRCGHSLMLSDIEKKHGQFSFRKALHCLYYWSQIHSIKTCAMPSMRWVLTKHSRMSSLLTLWVNQIRIKSVTHFRHPVNLLIGWR